MGAYNPLYQEYADFSGRGYPIGEGTAEEGKFFYEQQMKPDLCAPGTDLLVPDGQGSYAVVSGTSFAAPFADGVGDRAGERSVSVRGESEGLFYQGGEEAAGVYEISE